MIFYLTIREIHNNFNRSKTELEQWAEKRAGNRSRHFFGGGGKRDTGGARVSERWGKMLTQFYTPSCFVPLVAFLKFTQRNHFPKRHDEPRCVVTVPDPDQFSDRKNSIYGTLTRMRSKRSQHDLQRLGREISPRVRILESWVLRAASTCVELNVGIAMLGMTLILLTSTDFEFY